MFQDTITLGNILTILTLIVGGLSAWFLLRGDVTATKADVAKLTATTAALALRLDELRQRIEDVRGKGAQDLADYKLDASRSYATRAAIKEVEERVVEAINRLGDRFDKYFDAAAIAAPAQRKQGTR